MVSIIFNLDYWVTRYLQKTIGSIVYYKIIIFPIVFCRKELTQGLIEKKIHQSLADLTETGKGIGKVLQELVNKVKENFF